MNFLKLYLLVFALTNITYAAKITDPVLNVGKTATSDFTILHKDGGYIKKTGSQGDWLFSVDGILEKKIGSGSGSGGSGGVNLLLNNGFEDGTTDWTNTGGTFTQESYTSSIESNTKYARFVATTSGQYLETSLVTVPDFFGAGCMADFNYNQGDDAFTYKVINSTSDVLSSGTISDISGWQKAPIITLPCPTVGQTYRLRVESTGAGTIDIDDAYLGSNKNVSDINAVEEQMSSFTYSGKSSDNTVRFSSGLAGVADIAGDIFTYSDDGTVGTLLTFNKAAKVTLTARLGNSSVQGFWIQLDGQNLTAETTAQSSPVDTGSATARVFVAAGQVLKVWGSTSTFNQGSMVVTAETRQTKLSTYTPEQADFGIEASIGGAVIQISSGTTTYTSDLENSSLDMILHSGSASIPCSGTNPSTGLTCASGNEVVGIVFNNPTSGKYKVCFNFSHNNQTDPTNFKIVRTENASQTVLDESPLTLYTLISASNQGLPTNLCGNFDLENSGKKTFRLRYRHAAGTSGDIWADRVDDRNMTVTVEQKENNVSRPVIQNMVDTAFKAGKRVEDCYMDATSGTPTSAHVLCNHWINNYVDVGVGEWVVNIEPGIFSGNPICQANYNTGNASSGFIRACQTLTTSPTSFDLSCRQANALADARVTISCRGEK